MNVVAEDPVRQGLLFAGTSRGVYVSFDDGVLWQSLSLQLPTASVRDLLVHQGDLIAATQGRGIWVLDNMTPLREVTGEVAQESEHLFQPAPAWRLRGNENRDTPWPPSTPLAKNPPTGAIIDYWLKKDAEGPVTLTVFDPQGKVVRRFSSEEEPEHLNAERYFEEGWLGAESRPVNRAGMHRFVWDLRYPRPEVLEYSYSIAAVWKEGTPLNPRGPLVLPGEYDVVLKANGREYEKKLTVRIDPRVNLDETALRDQMEFARLIIASLEDAARTYKTIDRIREQRREALAPGVADSLSALADGSGNGLKSVCSSLADLLTAVLSADAFPTQGQRDVFDHYQKQLDPLLLRWNNVKVGLSDQKE